MTGDDDSDDLITELFGDVIFSYTDEEAVQDGVLIPFIVNEKDTHHRITSNAFHELRDHYRDRGSKYEDSSLVAFVFAELLPLAPYAYQAWEGGKILKTDYDFQVIVKGDPPDILWYVPNELRGVTIMRPQDY